MKKPMFPILAGKLAEKGLTQNDLASHLNITAKTVSKKMLGQTEFSWGEVVSIRDAFFPDMSTDVLMTQSTQ